MYRLIIYFYIFISFFVSYGIVRSVKPKNWIICLAVTYWFTISPIVRSRVFLSINPFMHITGTPWRIEWQITSLLLIIIILKFLSGRRSPSSLKISKIPKYEIFFYSYLILSIIAVIYHVNHGNMPKRLEKINIFYYYELILFYFVLKKSIDEDFIKCILKATIYMSVLSTIISPIQFHIDSYFMRTDRMPLAFGTHQRSSGIFQYGDQHAFIATVAMFYILFHAKSKLLKVLSVIFISYGILYTFSRGVWITFLAVIFLHLYFVERKLLIKIMKFVLIPGIFLLIVFKPYLPDFNKYLEGNEAMEERVLSDTFTPRMEYNYIVFNTILDRWAMGYGSLLDNETYYKMMYALGGKEWAGGKQGGIHNLYLSELFLKGTFVSLSLILFLLLFLKYSLSKGLKKNNYLYLLSFYYVFSYALYQMTAAAFITNYAATMAVFFMAVISAVDSNKLDVSEYTFIPESERE